ncbi:DUF255 domain-containing protein [Flavobacteriaceae bacterium AU392]|nr:DUF255 domain-containing protein [Flavobacteriaceae bacterium]RKM86961.1 DUF255 domain-containing protein [Flavobacteriaceae bacterium AU392]
MKKVTILIILTLFTSVNIIAQEINWMTLEEAVALQKENPKKIIMDAYTNWCGPCKILDSKTFHNPDVVKYVNENYYAVKFNAEGNSEINFKNKVYKNPGYKAELANRRNSPHEFSIYLGIRAYPTIVFMDEQGNLLAPIVGFKQPQELELYLKLFKTDAYKTLTSQEAFDKYYASFKAEFKEI